VTRALSPERKAANRAAVVKAREDASARKVREDDLATIRILGPSGALAWASTETEVCRRASVLLGSWDDQGRQVGGLTADAVKRLLARWLRDNTKATP